MLLRNKELENNRSQVPQPAFTGKGTEMSEMLSQCSEPGPCAVWVSVANKWFSYVYTRFLYSFRSVTSDLRRPFPLACYYVGLAGVSAKNAALPWWRVNGSTARELHPPPINAEHKAGQAVNTIFQVFGMTRHRTQCSTNYLRPFSRQINCCCKNSIN